MTNLDRPVTAPDFLLSRHSGSLRSSGSRSTWPDPFEAATMLRDGDAEILVGAVPFDTGNRAALTVPERYSTSDCPLEPPAHYRGQTAARRAEVVSVSPLTTLEEHQSTVAAAIGTIHASTLEKVVLARAVDVQFADEVDPLLIAARMIDLSAERDGFAVDLGATGRHDDRGSMLVGSSPELLVRRRGTVVEALPLAGSAPRLRDRNADAGAGRQLQESTKNLAEHRWVTDHYRRVLSTVCTELDIPDTPGLIRTNEMWHLGTRIRGRVPADGPSALDLALMLHPTPAVGGCPTEAALGIIDEVEEPRDFYGGVVGWGRADGDGEYMVSIRCAEVAGAGARAWAGGGIVASSSAAEETAETTAKLQTALRALNVPASMRSV
ncbi:isochorismate synthase [Corynebacterium neomassiliense]|uniref:isochorismate synthase n=1 Tax=Corynebacterium neomassiliense TaxID=2079482 RepID=UPI00102F4401|nr:chorismate-binding protein [Corynebacterium neomassiliense]